MMMKRSSLLEELEAMVLHQRMLQVSHAATHDHVMQHVCGESGLVAPCKRQIHYWFMA